jgi:hypothetical protein
MRAATLGKPVNGRWISQRMLRKPVPSSEPDNLRDYGAYITSWSILLSCS